MPADLESVFHFTLDGARPGLNSPKHPGPAIAGGGKITVKAIAHDPLSGQSSAVAQEAFYISKQNWQIRETSDD